MLVSFIYFTNSSCTKLLIEYTLLIYPSLFLHYANCLCQNYTAIFSCSILLLSYLQLWRVHCFVMVACRLLNMTPVYKLLLHCFNCCLFNRIKKNYLPISVSCYLDQLKEKGRSRKELHALWNVQFINSVSIEHVCQGKEQHSFNCS